MLQTTLKNLQMNVGNCQLIIHLTSYMCAALEPSESSLKPVRQGPLGVAITNRLHLSPSTEVTLGLEAQQKYSTGYIQCVHEVHNMLLTCEWMDKTLGSRLLNHLLKSLPRSADPCSPQGVGAALGGGSTTARHLERKRPTAHVADRSESPPPHGPRLGVLEMWRPW